MGRGSIALTHFRRTCTRRVLAVGKKRFGIDIPAVEAEVRRALEEARSIVDNIIVAIVVNLAAGINFIHGFARSASTTPVKNNNNSEPRRVQVRLTSNRNR